MMILIFLLIAYVALVIIAIHWTFQGLLQKEVASLQAVRDQWQETLRLQDRLLERKKNLEVELLQNLTLYDLTREMTKSFSEERMFEVFKTKLAQNVRFSQCFLWEPAGPDDLVKSDLRDFMVLPLNVHGEKLGRIALKGIDAQSKDTARILADQFALALRRARLYQDIERLAITDSLTDVRSRRYMIDRFEEECIRAMANKTLMSFLMIDIDLFKNFNDQYGHLIGDQILKEVARIIKSNIREIDVAGRFGGEEFCVILPQTDEQQAGIVAERIRNAVESATIKADEIFVKATVSVGISVFPRDSMKVNELVDKADWALYRAKKSGRNRIADFSVYP